MHCLNLKLTYDCSNDCKFCFSKHLKGQNLPLNDLLKVIEKAYSDGAREIVLSGGEPTFYEEKFLSCLAFAEKIGYEKYIVQTNGFGLVNNSKIFNFIEDFSKKSDVTFSFSIHGANAKTHDELSSSHGAFEILLSAMKKIFEKTSCKIFTNTVMTQKNFNELQEIVDLVKNFQPEIIQFAMMHTKNLKNLRTTLKDSAIKIRSLKINREILKTDGLPFCSMYGFEECVGESYWPEVLDVYNGASKIFSNFSQLENGMRWRAGFCKNCLMDELCAGIWIEHKDEFLKLKIHPIC